MTEDQFMKRHFRAYCELNYCHPRREPVSCMLLGIDWDHQSFKLVPFDTEYYEDKEFWASREVVEFPAKNKQLKALK